MHDLTPRQVDILKHIIREYIDGAEPVGSEMLEKKYDLGVSPATIRNEMADMEKLKYLVKSHTSSGRIPTSRALKFYVQELMREKQLSVAEEVEAKEQVWDARSNVYKFLRLATRNLSHKTRSLAVAVTDQDDIFYSGYSHILDMPEFYDIDVTKNLLNILDEISYLNTVLAQIQDQCGVCFGEEVDVDILRPYSFVFSRFSTRGQHTGSIGVIGPTRLPYEIVLPMVRYYGRLIEEVSEW